MLHAIWFVSHNIIVVSYNSIIYLQCKISYYVTIYTASGTKVNSMLRKQWYVLIAGDIYKMQANTIIYSKSCPAFA